MFRFDVSIIELINFKQMRLTHVTLKVHQLAGALRLPARGCDPQRTCQWPANLFLNLTINFNIPCFFV
jgi:hypothetical protein